MFSDRTLQQKLGTQHAEIFACALILAEPARLSLAELKMSLVKDTGERTYALILAELARLA